MLFAAPIVHPGFHQELEDTAGTIYTAVDASADTSQDEGNFGHSLSFEIIDDSNPDLFPPFTQPSIDPSGTINYQQGASSIVKSTESRLKLRRLRTTWELWPNSRTRNGSRAKSSSCRRLCAPTNPGQHPCSQNCSITFTFTRFGHPESDAATINSDYA